MDQQHQTLSFFSKFAENWQSQATYEGYNLIENRHLAVMETIKSQAGAKEFLDVGCGTGQLAIMVAASGINAQGLDFAPEMVEICRKNAQQQASNAQFVCASIFDVPLERDFYDVISAQGFIEYISLAQLDNFLAKCHQALKPGGKLAVGSRNRLFNLHSLNDYTELELSLGTAQRLVEEARALQMAPDQASAMAALAGLMSTYDQPTKHPKTGIDVDTRYQFSPADLIGRLQRHGLNATRLFPANYHALPLSLMAEPELDLLQQQLATLASHQLITRHQLVPYSSSFVLEAQKPA